MYYIIQTRTIPPTPLINSPMEKIFGWALGLGVIACLLLGRTEAILPAATEAAAEGISLTVGLLGICALWGGLMKMADGAGLTTALAKVLRPVTAWLFPSAQRDPAARQAIAAAFAANLMGIGNAATPLGVRAMQALPVGREADTFWLLCASGLQILPTTVIALRAGAGAANPAAVLPVCLAATAASTVAALLLRPRK